MVTITQGKVVGLDTATGALLWERPFVSNNDTNSVTPVAAGSTVIVSGNGGPSVAFAIGRKGGQWATETLWENADIPARFNDPVIAGDLLIGMAQRNTRAVLRRRHEDAARRSGPPSRVRAPRAPSSAPAT